MELRKALMRVARWAGLEGPRSGIRLIPAVYGLPEVTVGGRVVPQQPARVVATDGEVGCWVTLSPGEDVPDVVMDARGTLQAMKAMTGTPVFGLEVTGPRQVTVRGGGQMVAVGAWPSEEFPVLPECPTAFWEALGIVQDIHRVTHAALQKPDPDRPNLAYLHCREAFTEATDERRVARVRAALLPGRGLVPARLFSSWPAGRDRYSVWMGTSHQHCFLQVAEELRFARISPAEKFWDLDGVLPDDKAATTVLHAESLLKLVEGARKVAERDLVELRFGDGRVAVCGMGGGGEQRSCGSVPLLGCGEAAVLVLKGRLVTDALLAFRNRAVRVSWGHAPQPLRFSDDRLTAAIWPLVPDPPQEAADARSAAARHRRGAHPTRRS